MPPEGAAPRWGEHPPGPFTPGDLPGGEPAQEVARAEHLSEALLDRGGRSLRLDVVLPAPPGVVFEALTREDLLESWFSDRARVELRIGGAWEHRFLTETSAAIGEIEELQVPRRLAFGWHPPAAPGPTMVSLALEARGPRTLIALLHSGFGEGPAWDAEIERQRAWWRDTLWRLSSFLSEGRTRQVVTENIRIAAPPESVWQALTTSRLLNGWWTDTSRLDPRPGGEFRFVWEGTGEAFGAVTEATPPTRLKLFDEASATTFLFHLLPEEGGTLLTVVHGSFGRPTRWREGTERFWRDTLRILMEYLEALQAHRRR